MIIQSTNDNISLVGNLSALNLVIADFLSLIEEMTNSKLEEWFFVGKNALSVKKTNAIDNITAIKALTRTTMTWEGNE